MAEAVERSLNLALRWWFGINVVAPVLAGLAFGWDAELKLASLAQLSCAGWTFVLMLRSVSVIRACRAARPA